MKNDDPRRKCPVCGELAYRNARGELLMHTRTIGYKVAEPCPGAKKGAKP